MYHFFPTVYGIGKAACDRMAADCAHELKKSNVAMVSLWPGPVKTEFITENVIQKPKGKMKKKEIPKYFRNPYLLKA